MLFKPLLLLFGSVLLWQGTSAKLKEKFSWKQMEFDWPNAEAEQEAIQSGEYVAENNLPLGVERWQNKVFVTVPRWKAGVAATLNYIDFNTEEKSPKLRPYPSWEANKLPNTTSEEGLQDNSTVVSIFRLAVDACDRLWALDTGLADITGEAKQVTPNAIVVFDLKTDKLIRRFPIPASQVKETSFFANIVIDTDRSECDNAYAYVPDLGAYGVIVYSFADNHSYRVTHNYFHFDPLQGDFNVGGVNFQWTDGVFALAVGPKNPDGSKDVYFHALASTKEFKVNNRVLQNETHVTGSDAYYDFKYVGDRGMNGQSTSEVYDPETNSIFYTQINKDAVGCWNLNKPYNPDTQGLVDSDSHTLIFANELKIDAEGNVWVLTDKMPLYLYKELDHSVVNYRLMMDRNIDLVKGTPCEK